MVKKELSGGTGSIEIGVWVRLLSCTNVILHHLRRNLKESFALSLPRFDLLAQVARPPLGPSLSQLSRKLLVTKGNITDIVARLEAVELIERRRDDADGRLQYVFLTPEGRRLLDDILPVHDKWIRDLMQELSREELETLYDALGILRAALKRLDARDDEPELAPESEEGDSRAQVSR
ncbi:MAG: MarR family transcriptional regulator [Xanthobacteraceae bacterium]